MNDEHLLAPEVVQRDELVLEVRQPKGAEGRPHGERCRLLRPARHRQAAGDAVTAHVHQALLGLVKAEQDPSLLPRELAEHGPQCEQDQSQQDADHAEQEFHRPLPFVLISTAGREIRGRESFFGLIVRVKDSDGRSDSQGIDSRPLIGLNLDPSNPFEIVGGTSLWAPAWAGLLALANQGRVAAGEATLNSSTPTDTQQALYMLPQSDYNMIATGNNGYTAGAGYNLATGLGTPVASTLVPDLVAYHGPGTSYSGPTIAALRNVNLVNSGTSSGSPIDVFSVFDSFTVRTAGSEWPSILVSAATSACGTDDGAGPARLGPGHWLLLSKWACLRTRLCIESQAPGLVPRPVAGVTGTQVSVKLMPRQPAWSGARPWASLGSQGTRSHRSYARESARTRSPFVFRPSSAPACLRCPTRSWTNWPPIRSCGECLGRPDPSTSRFFRRRGWRMFPARPIH